MRLSLPALALALVALPFHAQAPAPAPTPTPTPARGAAAPALAAKPLEGEADLRKAFFAGMRKIPRGPRESTRQNAFGLTTTTSSVFPMLIVNGPSRDDRQLAPQLKRPSQVSSR